MSLFSSTKKPIFILVLAALFCAPASARVRSESRFILEPWVGYLLSNNELEGNAAGGAKFAMMMDPKWGWTVEAWYADTAAKNRSLHGGNVVLTPFLVGLTAFPHQDEVLTLGVHAGVGILIADHRLSATPVTEARGTVTREHINNSLAASVGTELGYRLSPRYTAGLGLDYYYARPTVETDFLTGATTTTASGKLNLSSFYLRAFLRFQS